MRPLPSFSGETPLAYIHTLRATLVSKKPSLRIDQLAFCDYTHTNICYLLYTNIYQPVIIS